MSKETPHASPVSSRSTESTAQDKPKSPSSSPATDTLREGEKGEKVKAGKRWEMHRTETSAYIAEGSKILLSIDMPTLSDMLQLRDTVDAHNASLALREQGGEDTKRLIEALSWALDILDLTNAHLKKIDPEGWRLDWKLDEVCNAKARKALADAARGTSQGERVGDEGKE